eukprot:g21120.t1
MFVLPGSFFYSLFKLNEYQIVSGMGDNEDIQVICCQLLQDLCSWNFALFRIMGRVGDLVEPFDRCIMRWIKQVQAKQQVGRAMDMLRLYARTLKVVEPIAEANQHKVFVDFMGRIMKELLKAVNTLAVARCRFCVH